MTEFAEIPWEQGWQRIKESFDKLCELLDKLYNESLDNTKPITRKEHSEVYT